MRKIKEEGPYAGRNILVFDSEGKAVPKSSMSVIKTNQYFQSLVKPGDKEKRLMMQPNEAESEEEGEYMRKVKKNMDENKDIDDRIAKERIKTKRIKKKVFLKKLMGVPDREAVHYDDEEYGAESSEEQSAQYSEQDD